MTTPTIGIVGAGASGILAGIHLLRTARRPVRLALIDRRSAPGRGVAYGTLDPLHLLNVRAGNMSALPDAPGHFARWAQVDPSEFVARKKYATYLDATLRAAQAAAATGVVVESLTDDVEDVTDDAAALELRTNGQLEVERVVLALGNFPPRPLQLPRASIPVYQDPWSPAALDGLDPDATVLLVGSGLTMVDVVVSLIGGRGHRGQIYAVSRRGQVPQVHAVLGPAPSEPPVAMPAAALALLRVIRDAAQSATDWRAVVDGLRPVTQATWQHLPLAERERFLRHLQPYWDTHRHRIAPRIGQVVADARQTGQVCILAGRLLDVTDTCASITLRHGGQRTLEVARVINCTGPATSFAAVSDPLLQQLEVRGLATPDALRLGFATVHDGRLVDRCGQPSQRVFSLGPMRRGELWETISVPDIRVQAAQLAGLLVDELDVG